MGLVLKLLGSEVAGPEGAAFLEGILQPSARRLIGARSVYDQQALRPVHQLAGDGNVNGCLLLVPSDHPHLQECGIISMQLARHAAPDVPAQWLVQRQIQPWGKYAPREIPR